MGKKYLGTCIFAAAYYEYDGSHWIATDKILEELAVGSSSSIVY